MYFICRWREESPFSKRVVVVPDATVLDWFRRGWNTDDPDEWVESQLGGYVYGLESIFEEAHKRGLPEPRTVGELRDLLRAHLYTEHTEGDPVRLDEHALRVRTDDDEVDLAYYFIDEQAAAAAPDRLAFLLNDAWPLPSGAAGTPFEHDVPVRRVVPAGPGPDAVFSVRLSWESPETYRNLDLAGPLMFPGVTLPELPDLLRAGDGRRWPHDARLLRHLTADGDIGTAMERYARLPGYDVGFDEDLMAEPRPESLIERDDHIVQVARYIDGFFGFDQWFLFDTRWAAAHPDLARSLLRYAAHWDPFEP